MRALPLLATLMPGLLPVCAISAELPASAAAPAPVALPPLQTVAVPTPPARTVPEVLAVGLPLTMDSGSGRVIALPAPAASAFAADPKVAEVKPASATALFVFAVAPGRTTIAALDAAGTPIAQFEVTVRPSAYSAREAAAAIAREGLGRGVRVDPGPNGLVVSGEVPTPDAAERIAAIVGGYLGDKQQLDNRLSVLASTQVTLRVRIAEVSRAVIRELGLNWSALGNIGRLAVDVATNSALPDATNVPAAIGLGYRGTVNANGMIEALAQDGLASILAEPNLTARSGETASFLVGGEFPIPVALQNNEISIEFKQYGISLAFVPTVQNAGHISLRVRPEVSELTDQGAVKLSVSNQAISIPALTVRRAETTVELGSGQSFAIAGLLSDSNRQTGRALPGIGETPVLGALFRSDQYQRNETELVIVVTPYIVRPVSDPGAFRLPTDGYQPPSDTDRFLYQRQTASAPAVSRRSAGSPGFIIE